MTCGGHVRADAADRCAATILESVDDHGIDDGQRRGVRGDRGPSCARAGCIPPIDSEFPLEKGGEAFERLQSGEQFGKVVVRVADA